MFIAFVCCIICICIISIFKQDIKPCSQCPIRLDSTASSDGSGAMNKLCEMKVIKVSERVSSFLMAIQHQQCNLEPLKVNMRKTIK